MITCRNIGIIRSFGKRIDLNQSVDFISPKTRLIHYVRLNLLDSKNFKAIVHAL